LHPRASLRRRRELQASLEFARTVRDVTCRATRNGGLRVAGF
jgi:hypothetical protein